MRLMPFSDDLSSPTIGLKQPFAQDSTALRIDDHASSKSRRQHSARDYFDASLQSMPLVQVEMLSRIESLVWALSLIHIYVTKFRWSGWRVKAKDDNIALRAPK